MASEGLHIIYRRTGGFAGIAMAADCLGADLPDDQAQVASDLLGEPNLEAPPTQLPGPGADQFTYTLLITQGTRSRTFSWSEGTVPDVARPLLATLGGLSAPSRVR